jgi:hypothetical protein
LSSLLWRRAVGALSVLAGLLSPTTAHAGAGPGDTVVLPVREALAALPVQAEIRSGYERTAFRLWTDADRDGCSTRAEVLLQEALTAPARDERCRLTGGSWFSPYDDLYIDAAGSLDIDHLVPLAEAWDSGARAWTPARRQAYANDLDDPRALIAVSARSNRSKADQDPADWMPPSTGYRCTYATDWITIKTRWQLTVDQTEEAALAHILDTCPDAPVKVVRAS